MYKILSAKLRLTGSVLTFKRGIGTCLSSTSIGIKALLDLPVAVPSSCSWRFGTVSIDLSKHLSKYCHSIQFTEIPQGQMKLYTDKGNPYTLKVLAATFLSGQDVTIVSIELVKQESFKKAACLGKSKLPVLEIEPDKFLVSPNAMCCYLMEQCPENPKERTPHIDEMIEWDSTHLQVAVLPYLMSHVVGGKCDTQLGNAVMRLLSKLNARLEKNSFVAGDAQSVADIVVWGTLFAVLEGSLPLADLESKCPLVLQWFRNLSSQDAFATAVSKVTDGKGVQCFKESLQGIHLFPSVTRITSDESGSRKVGVPRDESENDEREGLFGDGPSAAEILAAKKSWANGKSLLQKAKKYEHPILPKSGEKNILVTSALPYVNNVPHLGNIIGCVLSGDVYARYCRLRNYNILYISGTDEYGTATETKAIEEGLTPQQICDKYNKKHCDVYNWFNIEFDYFGRTTTKEQTEIAQDIFWKLHHNDYLLKDSLDQLQCIKCNRFLADRFVEGTCPFCAYEDARGDQCDACGKLINAIELKSPRCKMCGSSPVVKTTNHIFLDLPKVEPLLRKWLTDTMEKGNWSKNSKNITKGWLQEGLRSRCITRDLKWGTPVPMEGYTEKVFYVWFDAPIGYLSITKNYTEQWEKWWKNPEQVTLVQFMAKDNVPFHTVVFPCSLLGADDNYTLLNSINATEYLNYEDDKFSKSRGVGVFGDDAADTGIPADIYRFYLLFLRPENQDSAFSWSDLILRNNSELLNNFGNFINRALMFLKNSFNGTQPEVELQEDDFKFIASVNKELGEYIEVLEKQKLRDGLQIVLNISKIGNQYIQANKPWVLVKGNEQEKLRSGSVIGLACNLSALLSILVRPYMPKVSDEIQDQLQFPAEFNVIPDAFVTLLPSGHKIGKPKPLFQKLENILAEQLKERFSGGQKSKQIGKDSTNGKENDIPGDVATIEAEVTKQGDAVRKAKTEKAAKDVIDAEVAKLLELKKRLAIAKGQNPNEAPPKGKSKDKKKAKRNNLVLNNS